MFKLVMYNSNIEFLKTICNCIINEIPEIQLSGITTYLEEFNILVSKVKPEIILLNHYDYIHSNYRVKSEFPKFKIIFHNPKLSYKNTQHKLFISETASLSEMKKLIKEFILKRNVETMRPEVIKLLENFSFDFKLIGTTYLLESILYCYEKKTEYIFENLERNVYPYVAKKCNATEYNVKWSILRCIDITNTHNNLFLQKQLFNKTKATIYDKVTPKQLISTIVTKIS